MNTLTSDVLQYFNTNDMWNICKMMDSIVTKYYIDLGLDRAGIKALRMLRKTTAIRSSNFPSFRDNKRFAEVICASDRTTKALESQIEKNLYGDDSIFMLAFDEAKRLYVRLGRPVNMYRLHDIARYVNELWYDKPKFTLSPHNDRDIPTKAETEERIQYGKFIICVHNMMNAMCGLTDRIKLLYVKHGDACYYCGKINCTDSCADCGSFYYEYRFILKTYITDKYRTNWFYKKNKGV